MNGDDYMEAKIQKWGNSLGFKNYHGDNLAKDFSWDNPKGKELW